MGLVPPWVMIPWIRAPSRMCWRRAFRPTKVWITASRALIPSSGLPEAWAGFPWNSIFTSVMESDPRSTRVRSAGCTIIATSTSEKIPASMSLIFPPPPSSAGVPITMSFPGRVSLNGASPNPAPRAMAAMMLWPQAWPSSGSASYSARKATAGPSACVGCTATKAVSMPPTPRSTWKPPFSRAAVSQAAALCSSNPSSGFSWIFRAMSQSSSAISSILFQTSVFTWDRSMVTS